MIKFNMKSKIWLYPGSSAWHFVTLPKKDAQEIKKLYLGLERGWGSLPVEVTIGETQWKTSIFPDKKAGSYLLPLKSQIRKKENLKNGMTIKFSIEVMV